ncbi:MAG: hypothetical protein ABI395_07490 [Sphingobium sp.]
MIITALMLLQVYSRETEAVMDRSRRQAQERRANSAELSPPPMQPKPTAPPPGEAAPALPPAIAQKLRTCLNTAAADPAAGVRFATDWAVNKGSFYALQCRGFAHARTEDWDQSVAAFDAAAGEAEKAGSSADAARLWGQAGNAALAGGKAEAAIGYFDAALGHGAMSDIAKGEVYLDRARAGVMLGRDPAARDDLNKAVALVSQDPLAWLLSATLARRMNDLPRASADIAQAAALAGDDPSVMLEQGNIAMLSGNEVQARSLWQNIIAHAPDGAAAKAANAALAQLSEPKPAAAK